ncbi:MAG: archaellin/type IV pilin N-terminal domain-containing protein [Candidatus Hodarchaeota archaeon]
MKISQVFQFKRRGVTPVIATILLIGLVVVAGIGVAIIMFGTINAPDPIEIKIEEISGFETTDKDFLIDRFQVKLQNKERTSVIIQADAFNIILQNGTEKVGWQINRTQNEYILPGLEELLIPLACDPTDDRSELAPNNDTVYVEVTVFPEDSPRNEKTYRSSLLIVGDTTGPFYLTSYISEPTLKSGGLNLTFNVANFGSSDRDLSLEFTGSSDIYFEINGYNKTRHYFSLVKFTNTTFSDDTFTVKPESSISDEDIVIIEVWLWDQESLKQISYTYISLIYEA